MKILALDFSSPQRSAAVLEGGILSERVETGGRNVNALSLIEGVLRDAGIEREQVDCLAVGIGPGSYTGIRAAIALAQGWQLATGVKLLGVSSAEGVAAQARAEGLAGTINVVIDAQRNEFYLARYELDLNGAREVAALRLASLAEIQARERAGEILSGPEVIRWVRSGKVIFPHAARLGELARKRTDFNAGGQVEPIYLRETTFVKAPPSRVL